MRFANFGHTGIAQCIEKRKEQIYSHEHSQRGQQENAETGRHGAVIKITPKSALSTNRSDFAVVQHEGVGAGARVRVRFF